MKVDKFKRGQIWWLQENKIYDGNVQSGTRPVIIISNDANNRHSNNLTVVPCTSQDKKDLPTHFTFTINEESIALAECIRTVNKERIGTYIGTCDDEIMKAIDNIVKIALGLNVVNSEPVKINKPIICNEHSTDKLEDNLKENRGRKPKYTSDEMIKFIKDYEHYDMNFMLEKYGEKSAKAVTNKVYRFRKLTAKGK